VVVIGPTDRIGPLSYNMTVSERLASVAKDYLVETEHVDPSLIFWEGNGPSRPIPVTEFCSRLKGKQLIECLAPIVVSPLKLSAPQRHDRNTQRNGRTTLPLWIRFDSIELADAA